MKNFIYSNLTLKFECFPTSSYFKADLCCLKMVTSTQPSETLKPNV